MGHNTRDREASESSSANSSSSSSSSKSSKQQRSEKQQGTIGFQEGIDGGELAVKIGIGLTKIGDDMENGRPIGVPITSSNNKQRGQHAFSSAGGETNKSYRISSQTFTSLRQM